VKSSQGRAVEALKTLRAEVQKYEELCADLGEDPARVGLAWVLSRPGVTAPVIGPRTFEHLEAAVGTLDLRLPDTTLTQLDELFPPIGNGGPAPEAWCW
jgi:NDP-hexose 2,3-enoyl reductase